MLEKINEKLYMASTIHHLFILYRSDLDTIHFNRKTWKLEAHSTLGTIHIATFIMREPDDGIKVFDERNSVNNEYWTKDDDVVAASNEMIEKIIHVHNNTR